MPWRVLQAESQDVGAGNGPLTPWAVRDVCWCWYHLCVYQSHPSPRAWEQPALPGAKAACFPKTCPVWSNETSLQMNFCAHPCSNVCHILPSLGIVPCRCGGTVGAIFTCPLEVIKTRLQSSKLAFRTVYYPQVQLGTISGEGMVRPTSVSPGLFSVLKWVLLLLSFTIPDTLIPVPLH